MHEGKQETSRSEKNLTPQMGHSHEKLRVAMEKELSSEKQIDQQIG